MPLSKYQYNAFNSNRNINSNVFSNIDKLNFKTSDSGYVISENWNNPINLDYSSPTTIPMVRATGVGNMLKQAFTFKNLNDAKSNLQCYGKECAKAVTLNTQNLTDNDYIHNMFRGHAWTKHMTASDRGYGYFSIYDDSNVFNENNKYDKEFVKSQSRIQALKPEFVNKIKKYATAGTPVTLLYPGSTHYGEAYRQSKGSMLSTHVGQVIEADGKKYVVDNISGELHYRPLDELLKGKSKDGVIITGMIDYNSTVNYDMSDLSDFNLNLSNDIQANGTHGNLGGITAYRALLSLDKNKDILMKEFGISENNLGFIQRAIPALMWKESQFGRLDNNITFNLKNRNAIGSTVGKIKNGNINKSRGLSQFKLGNNLTKEEIEKLGVDINNLTDEQLYSPELTAVVTSIILDKRIKAINKALGEKKQNLPDDIYETLIFQSWNQGLNNIIKNINNFKKSNDVSEFDGYMKPDEDGKYSYGVTTRELFNHYIDYKTGSLDYKDNESHLIYNKHNNINYIESLMFDIKPNINHIDNRIKSNINKNIRKINQIDDKIMNELKYIKRNIPFRKFGSKLRYGWGGIMSQDSLVKDMTSRPNKYNLTPANFNLTYSEDKITPSKYGTVYSKFVGGNGYDAYDLGRAWEQYAPLAEYDHKKFMRKADGSDYVGVELNDFAIGVLNDFMAQQQQTVVNMQNRIDNDINKVAKIKEQSQPIVRYGGVLVRPRFNYGGYYSDYSTPRIPYTSDYSMNNPITSEDVSDSEAMYGVEPIRRSTVLKGAGTGASIGGSVGALAGGIGASAGAAALTAAGATAWIPVIGPLVALVAAGIGAGIGAGVSKKKANQAAAQQLAQNKQQIAYDAELNRQNSVGNAINRIDKDVYKIQNTENNFNMSQGFYSKYGGMIKPRIKYANGGTILPNSNNTVVAFGRTHEQMNPITGETGITYGNAEIEGGGYVNGRELPGEVVRATPYGDEVFSDSIPIDNQGHTVADYAKMISDRKGVIEKIMNETRLNMERDIKNLNTFKAAKAKTGTLMRNIEKQAALFNKYTAESAKLDSDLEKLFAYQEQAASAIGLREGQPMRYGGSIRRTYDVGGWLSPLLSFGANALTSGLQYWTASADAKYKQEILNGLAKRTLPKRAKEDPILLDPEYDITPEMNATEREASRIEKYIKDNVVNPKQARNLISKVRLDKLEQQNQLRGVKKSEEKKLVNANISSIITARNKNRINQYQDLVDQLNYDTNIAIQQMGIRSQKTQATQQLLRDLGQSATQAAQMYMASKSWAPGVTKDMNLGVDNNSKKLLINSTIPKDYYKTWISTPVYNPYQGLIKAPNFNVPISSNPMFMSYILNR